MKILAAVDEPFPKQSIPIGDGRPISQGFANLQLQDILQTGLELMFLFAVLLSLFFILWAAIQWISSGGDKEGLAKARARLTYAIVGLIIVFAAFFIVNFIGFLFNVSLIK